MTEVLNRRAKSHDSRTTGPMNSVQDMYNQQERRKLPIATHCKAKTVRAVRTESGFRTREDPIPSAYHLRNRIGRRKRNRIGLSIPNRYRTFQIDPLPETGTDHRLGFTRSAMRLWTPLVRLSSNFLGAVGVGGQTTHVTIKINRHAFALSNSVDTTSGPLT